MKKRTFILHPHYHPKVYFYFFGGGFGDGGGNWYICGDFLDQWKNTGGKFQFC